MCVVCIQKQVSATDGAVKAAQGHEKAVGEKIAVIKMAHTII